MKRDALGRFTAVAKHLPGGKPKVQKLAASQRMAVHRRDMAKMDQLIAEARHQQVAWDVNPPDDANRAKRDQNINRWRLRERELIYQQAKLEADFLDREVNHSLADHK